MSAVSIAHCIACFEALDSALTGHPETPLTQILALWPFFTAATPSAPVSPPTPPLSSPTKVPLFVTWNEYMIPSDEPVLRGCIGTFHPLDVEKGLADYAITAALHDRRFDPINKEALPKLEVAVTILTDFEDCQGKYDWEIGKHGIQIEFEWRGQEQSGTYLPDVIPEQNWTKDEALIHLMRKAGWRGKLEDWEKVELEVKRYQGKKCKAQYSDYKLWKEWHAEYKAVSK